MEDFSIWPRSMVCDKYTMQTTLFNQLYMAFCDDTDIVFYKSKTNGLVYTYNIITPSTEVVLIILSKVCILFDRRNLDNTMYIEIEQIDDTVKLILDSIKKIGFSFSN